MDDKSTEGTEIDANNGDKGLLAETYDNHTNASDSAKNFDEMHGKGITIFNIVVVFTTICNAYYVIWFRYCLGFFK